MANPINSDSITADGKGNGLLSDQQALVADASEAHALNATFSDTEVEAALDALGGKINAVLDILEAHGLMADS